MKTFLIADDHALVREGLRRTLQDLFPQSACEEAADAKEILAKIRKKRFDVVLLDLSLPGRNGLDVLKQITAARPELPVLILSMYEEKLFGLRSLRAGAAGYVTKKDSVTELKAAIKQVLREGKFISPALEDLLLMELRPGGERPLHDALTDDELGVLGLIAQGRKTKDIARDFSLSAQAINAMRGRILKKMKMKNNAELTRYAIKANIVL